MSDAGPSTIKLPLPTFLKALTSNNIPPSKAIAIASKLYKTYNTPAGLAQLTDLKLKSSGIDDKEDRKRVLSAIKKSGYKPSTNAASKEIKDPVGSHGGSAASKAGPSKKKRKRDDDVNQFLPEKLPDEGETYGSLEFNEILNEEALHLKHIIVNRAPIMTAWAFVVAERLGFQREEALSIASVYTEMNAISKGISIGIYEKGKHQGREASEGGSQPYVDLMGRRPLFQTASDSTHWRALSEDKPVTPSAAFSYITRSLRHTVPHIIGAMRLLAASYSPSELNTKGFALYADFRPEVDGWGKRGEVWCKTILALRKPAATAEIVEAQSSQVKDVEIKTESGHISEEPDKKKARGLTLEEYEAALDEDPTFGGLNFDDLP